MQLLTVGALQNRESLLLEDKRQHDRSQVQAMQNLKQFLSTHSNNKGVEYQVITLSAPFLKILLLCSTIIASIWRMCSVDSNLMLMIVVCKNNGNICGSLDQHKRHGSYDICNPLIEIFPQRQQQPQGLLVSISCEMFACIFTLKKLYFGRLHSDVGAIMCRRIQRRNNGCQRNYIWFYKEIQACIS